MPKPDKHTPESLKPHTLSDSYWNARLEVGAEEYGKTMMLHRSKASRYEKGYRSISQVEHETILAANGALDVEIAGHDISLPVFSQFPLVGIIAGIKVEGVAYDEKGQPHIATARIKKDTLKTRMLIPDDSTNSLGAYARVEFRSPSDIREVLAVIDKFEREKQHLWRDVAVPNPTKIEVVRKRCKAERRKAAHTFFSRQQ